MQIEQTALEYTLPAWQIFGVFGQSVTRCEFCCIETTRTWKESALYLNVVPGDAVFLRDCLSAYFDATPLEDRCDNTDGNAGCGKVNCRAKSEVVDYYPPLLVIVLKRWVELLPGAYRKEDRDVFFPATLTNEDLRSERKLAYDLRSVVEHSGDAGGGHHRDCRSRWRQSGKAGGAGAFRQPTPRGDGAAGQGRFRRRQSGGQGAGNTARPAASGRAVA